MRARRTDCNFPNGPRDIYASRHRIVKGEVEITSDFIVAGLTREIKISHLETRARNICVDVQSTIYYFVLQRDKGLRLSTHFFRREISM